MNKYKVSYEKFNPNNIIFGKTETQQSKADISGKKVTYYRIPISYKYEIQKSDGTTSYAISDLYIEGPKEKSRGPKDKEILNSDGSVKVITSIYTQYDLSKTEHFNFVNYDDNRAGTIHALVLKCCDTVLERSSDVNINDCSDTRDMMKKFHYPIKWEMDRGKPVPGKNPGGIWKLFKYGKEPNTVSTTFILPIDGGQKIDWDFLKNQNIEHRPLFKVNNITIAGGHPSIKIDLFSSVVYEMASRGTNDLQADLIREVEADEGLSSKLREQLRLAKEAFASVNTATSVAPNTPVVVPIPSEIPGLGAAMPIVAPIVVPSVPTPEVSMPAPVIQLSVPTVAAPPVISLPSVVPTLAPPVINLPSISLPALP
jgi:hypothetical protein